MWHDPRTDTSGVVATGFTYPNGLALSPDQLTLYVSDAARGVYRVHRDDPNTQEWSDPELVVAVDGDAYDALAGGSLEPLPGGSARGKPTRNAVSQETSE